MDKLVDLLERGILFQLFLALVVVVTVCYMAVVERVVPPELWISLWASIGYFFGTQVVEVAGGVLRKYVANLIEAIQQKAAIPSGYLVLSEDSLAGLVWLLERGVIAQGVFVIAVSVTVCYIAAIGHVAPRELWAAFGVIIGFFFGTRGTASMFRDVKACLESLSRELRPAA